MIAIDAASAPLAAAAVLLCVGLALSLFAQDGLRRAAGFALSLAGAATALALSGAAALATAAAALGLAAAALGVAIALRMGEAFGVRDIASARDDADRAG